MTTLGLRPRGRLGLSSRRRRPLTPPLSFDWLNDLAFWYEAVDPQNTNTGGAYVAMGAPAAVVPGARDDAGPFDHAEADALGTVGASRLLSATDQRNLIDWAGLK